MPAGESLSADAVRAAVEANQDRVRDCYARRAAARPGLEGRVEVRLTIAPDGTVAEAEASEDTTGDEELARCIVEATRAIRFPTATAATAVTYPFAVDPSLAVDAPAPEIEGSLAPEAILEAVRGGVEEVQACYAAALERSAETRGRVVVRFTVTAAGAVEGASAAEDTTGDPELTSCVVTAASRLSFPAAAGATTVTYPFVLMPGEGPPQPATPEGVRAAVAARSAELERCRRDRTGQVDVRFTIGTDGVVRAVEALANTTGDDDVALCVIDVIQGLSFAPGSEGTTITLPLALMPPSGD